MNINDCCVESASAAITVDAALHKITSQIRPLIRSETLPLKECLGRILGSDIHAPMDIPQHRNSAMDGYALRQANLPDSGTVTLKIIGTSWAGKPFLGKVENDQAVRIFTGAVLPETTDFIVIQEDVKRCGDCIELSPVSATQSYIRYPGDDCGNGQLILTKGKRLAPADIGILATLGISEVRVIQKPRVAFFSTGNELRPLHDQPGPGEIYDSNRYTLYTMLQSLGVDMIDLGVVGDDKKLLIHTLLDTATISDAIISSGGVSVGDADLVKSALDNIGKIEFWKIAIKPGKPLAFGEIKGTPFFGLPGNPVSVIVTFYKIVRPALLLLMGTTPIPPLRLKARCRSPIKKIPGRQEFQRGVVSMDINGDLIVEPAQKQQSHNLSGMVDANCFILLAADCQGIQSGESVEVELIDPPFSFN